jgi:hypothetical protein
MLVNTVAAGNLVNVAADIEAVADMDSIERAESG